MMKLNKISYEELVNEDIQWLLDNTKDTLERRHILLILENSKDLEYQEKSDLYNNVEWGFHMLQVYGVPKERAKSVANGIDVLATRFRKEIHLLNREIDNA